MRTQIGIKALRAFMLGSSIVSCQYCFASDVSCNSQVDLQGRKSGNSLELLEDAAKYLKVSVLAEIKQSKSKIEIKGTSLPLQDLIFAINPLAQL